MKTLFTEALPRQEMELYCEYLKKIPQLLTQLEAVEKMYEKALLEEQMLMNKDPADHSVALYADRLARTKAQCETRMADIRNQCQLVFALKTQIEAESSALQALIHPQKGE